MSTSIETHFVYPMLYGPITISSSAQGITRVSFGSISSVNAETSSLSNQAANELLEYFSGKRIFFEVPLDLRGSSFQKTVWKELTRIPYGQTRTSAEIAQLIGSPSSHRAVGAALKKNPLAILIPDHRIIQANGLSIGSGEAARMRTALLEKERAFLSQHA